MPEVTMIIMDNSYNQQNQDYLPNRFLLQKDTIKCLIVEKLQESPENEIGLVPLAQSSYSILTPTKDRHALEYYLTKQNLEEKILPSQIVNWSYKALKFRSQMLKTLLFFFGSKIDDDEELHKIIDCMNGMLDNGYAVKIVFYAEAVMYSETFEELVVGDNFTYVLISTEDDFYKTVMMLMGKSGDLMDEDPDLALAIELSKQEQ
ncbi:26S proteasome non-ATPase regulatory subunit 4 [Conglomerata obtusa]